MNSKTLDKPKRRRRSFFVNPAFQWKYAITFGFAVYITTTLVSCVLYGVLFEETRQRFLLPQSASFNAGFSILTVAVLFSLLTAGTVVVLSLMTSNRICGPLYVLQSYFDQIADGKIPTPRSLRKKDEFKDVFASFVRATEKLRADQQKQLESVEELTAVVKSVQQNAQDLPDGSLRRLTNELADLRMQIACALDIEPVPSSADGGPNPTLNEAREPVHGGV